MGRWLARPAWCEHGEDDMDNKMKRITYAVLSPVLVLACCALMAPVLLAGLIISPIYFLRAEDPFTPKKRGKAVYMDTDGLIYDDEEMTRLSTGVVKPRPTL